MRSEDLACFILILILFEFLKTKFSREYFTRKNNDFNIIVQDKDGNMQTMELKEIYDTIQQAITECNSYTDKKHVQAINHANTKQGKGDYIRNREVVYLYNFDKRKYLNHDASGGQIFTGSGKWAHEKMRIEK